MKKFINFLKNTVAEMKKVVWPNAQQTKRDTSVVIGMTVFFAAFLGFVDFVFQNLLSKLV
ncbi:preprotein translocase subunit SecE [Lactobacillus sp. S2-2]|uniref:preprotein translocase subunit SecE n=1 Tax=Lactobacillus sp. S2-2 TaxID=2692917 RepID=UPI001EFFBB9F|nr:preprotein translocase subunit SecE [Lactobacillus sp. S2-2]MCF6515646.1 preprotein translocase subunit SecE [Lactobacillus sp. S2-2]